MTWNARRGAARAVLMFVFHYVRFGCRLTATAFIDRLVRRDPAERRRRIARCQSDFAYRAFMAVCRALRIRMEISIPDGLEAEPPLVVISNHRSILDIGGILAYLHEAGRFDGRWILKRELAKFPLIGGSCRRTGCAFVRRGDPGDLTAVRACAEIADADGADVIIFPEGTRFTPERKNGFSHLIAPKNGGFRTLRQALPGRRVLSLTVHWGTAKPCKTVREVLQSLYRARLRIEGEVVDSRAEPDAWLRDEWNRKDARLSFLTLTGG